MARDLSPVYLALGSCDLPPECAADAYARLTATSTLQKRARLRADDVPQSVAGLRSGAPKVAAELFDEIHRYTRIYAALAVQELRLIVQGTKAPCQTLGRMYNPRLPSQQNVTNRSSVTSSPGGASGTTKL